MSWLKVRNARLFAYRAEVVSLGRLEPAAPPDLASGNEAICRQVLLDLGANYLAGAKDDRPSQSALISEGERRCSTALEGLCK